MKTLKLKKQQYEIYASDCEKDGAKIEHDVRWKLTSWLSEIPYYYFRVIKDGVVIAIVDLDEN